MSTLTRSADSTYVEQYSVSAGSLTAEDYAFALTLETLDRDRGYSVVAPGAKVVQIAAVARFGASFAPHRQKKDEEHNGLATAVDPYPCVRIVLSEFLACEVQWSGAYD